MTHIVLYTDRSDIYGVEQCNHILAKAFADVGYQTTVVQPVADHHLIDEREVLGIHHRWLEPDDLYDLSVPARMLTDFEEPHRILAAESPDLILFSDSCPFANLKAKQVAIDLDIPYLVVVHCVNSAWAEDYAVWLPELPEIYTHAQAVISVSQANLDLLNGMFGLPLDRGTVIYNGRPPEFFKRPDLITRQHIRAELGIPADATVCLTIARLEPSKGYQFQIDALLELRKTPYWEKLHFVWVGSGFMADRLVELIDLHHLANKVRILGSRQDVPDLFDSADVFVLPSQFEGMPLTVMEAMAKRLPVVATAVSGTPEAIHNSGFLLPDPIWGPISPVLARTIRWLAESEQLRREMGESAHKRAEQYFRLDTMVNNYLTLVAALFARRKSAQQMLGESHHAVNSS